MRDYVRMFYTQDSMPIVQFGAVTYYFFKTSGLCKDFVNSFAGSSPGGGTLTDPAPVWFRLNAEKVMAWIQNALPQNLGPDINAGGQQMTFVSGSPRDLGVNSRIEKKGFKNTQLGNVFTTFASEVLTGLAEYAATLRASGRVRDALIVEFAYKQVIALKWTVTEAFNYLIKNNL